MKVASKRIAFQWAFYSKNKNLVTYNVLKHTQMIKVIPSPGIIRTTRDVLMLTSGLTQLQTKRAREAMLEFVIFRRDKYVQKKAFTDHKKAILKC